MGGGNLASKSKKKGFAISGILYPLLILTLFLVVQILFMMQTRKNVLDKSKKELADSVNASNIIYNNEELSTLVDELKVKTKEIDVLKQKLTKWDTDYSKKIDDLYNDHHLNKKRNFYVSKVVKSSNYNPTIINILNVSGPTLVYVKMLGNYSWINYGGYVEYKLGATLEKTNLHGLGTSIDKKGSLGNLILSITPTYDSVNLKLGVNLNSSMIVPNGSVIYALVTIISEYGISDSTNVILE